ncbi:MAG TPA: hypothetical protein VKA28_02665 [Candidatus Bathyarchaeia archaeon]|nr:hypothetical protein [Candidatus Bathyarchaeia archaeon]
MKITAHEMENDIGNPAFRVLQILEHVRKPREKLVTNLLPKSKGAEPLSKDGDKMLGMLTITPMKLKDISDKSGVHGHNNFGTLRAVQELASAEKAEKLGRGMYTRKKSARGREGATR